MNARLLVALTTLMLMVTVACGGDGDDNSRPTQSPQDDESIELEGSSSSAGGGAFVETIAGVDSGNPLATGASLPGITVIGYGEATAKPEEVLIRLTIGQGEFGSFSSSDTPSLELIDQAELQPVIDALKEQGVEESTISVSTVVSSPYGFGGGSGQITFRWTKPDDLKPIFDLAEDTVRQETDHGLQNVEVLFTVKECEPLEQQASSAALEDARRRAERLAELAGLQLGAITAISEAPSAASVYGGPSGCAALEELPSFDFPTSSGDNSASEVEVDVSLQVTFALQAS